MSKMFDKPCFYHVQYTTRKESVSLHIASGQSVVDDYKLKSAQFKLNMRITRHEGDGTLVAFQGQDKPQAMNYLQFRAWWNSAKRNQPKAWERAQYEVACKLDRELRLLESEQSTLAEQGGAFPDQSGALSVGGVNVIHERPTVRQWQKAVVVNSKGQPTSYPRVKLYRRTDGIWQCVDANTNRPVSFGLNPTKVLRVNQAGDAVFPTSAVVR